MIYLAWSGGLDSTFALYDLLRRGYQVHAHHVYFHGGRHRFTPYEEERELLAWSYAESGWRACHKIAERLRKDGFEFSFTESAWHYGSNPCRIDIFLTMLPHVLNEALIAGVEEEDRIVFAVNADESHRARGAEVAMRRRWNDMARLYSEWGFSRTPIVVEYGQWQGRAEHVAALEPELADMVASCSRPKIIDGEYVPCGSGKIYTSPFIPHWDGKCVCQLMRDLIPRYANGWARDEEDA